MVELPEVLFRPSNIDDEEDGELLLPVKKDVIACIKEMLLYLIGLKGEIIPEFLTHNTQILHLLIWTNILLFVVGDDGSNPRLHLFLFQQIFLFLKIW